MYPRGGSGARGMREGCLMSGYCIRGVLCFAVLCSTYCLPSSIDADGIQIYRLGGTWHPWQNSGTLDEVMYDRIRGWIAPRIIALDENLSLSAEKRGGMAWSFWGDTWTSGVIGWGGKRMWRGDPLEWIIDGDSNTSYGQDYIGWQWQPARMGMLLVDLGGVFAVHRIRWQARMVSTSTRGILYLTVSVNDGDLQNRDGVGRPLLSPVWAGQIGATKDVDVMFPEETVHYVGVWVDAMLADAFALSELEVYGSGYVPKGWYTSRMIDFEKIVALGEIGWSGMRDSGAKVLIRTRSGMDKDPNIYWRKVTEGQLERLTQERKDGQPLTREDYEKLLSEDRGPITYDTDNWSFWSAPYDFEEGLAGGMPLTSPAPRRYLQIQLEFVSTPSESARVDSLWFEYSHPPCAHEILGEIYPIEVRPAETTMFTYALRPRILEDDTGFDTMEIQTPVPTEQVREVRIDRVPVMFTTTTGGSHGFVISFPTVQVDRKLVEVVFDSQVLRYSTEFVGRVWNSETEQVPQRIFPGDADERVSSDDLAVRLPLREPLIVSVDVMPNPFTPNGDGINDETLIRYSLLHLTAPASVEVKVYGLSMRKVTTLYAGKDINGNYTQIWDGKDDGGRMVCPGIYIYRIQVDADSGTERKMGIVNIVY